MEQNLSLYRIFHETARVGNISRAAKNLYISQPAISKSIGKLEEGLDCKLFVRNSRGVQLTEEGELLFAHTTSAFDSLGQVEQQLAERKEKGVGKLRIGTSTTLCKYILIPILSRFIKGYPNIKCSITCQSTLQTVKLLEEGKIDIALAGKIDTSDQFHFQKYSDVQDIFVSAASYLEQFGGDIGAIFRAGNLMLLDEDNISRIYINQFLHSFEIETERLLEISTMDLLIEFAKIGLGVACVIKEFIQEELEEKTLVPIPLAKEIGIREVGFIYGRNGLNQNSVNAFCSLL